MVNIPFPFGNGPGHPLFESGRKEPGWADCVGASDIDFDPFGGERRVFPFFFVLCALLAATGPG